MKKIMIIALISAFGITSPVYAQTPNDENMKEDVQALDKDNKALHKKHAALKKDRAAKAADKANGDSGKQAVDSMKIGADKTGIEEKKVEKSMDEKTLAKHKNASEDETTRQ